MAQDGHTYGPACVFYDEDSLPVESLVDSLTPPPVKAQFFYISALPIDDPLSPLPPISTATSKNVPPQPFAVRDNAALEEAWQGLSKQEDGTDRLRPGSRGLHRMFSFPKFRSGLKSPDRTSPTTESSAHGIFASLPERKRSATSIIPRAAKDSSSPEALSRRPSSRPHRKSSVRSNSSRYTPQFQVDQQMTLEQGSRDRHGSAPVDAKELQPAEQGKAVIGRRRLSPFRRQSRQGNSNPETVAEPEAHPAQLEQPLPVISTNAGAESSMSGRPFARAPSTRQMNTISTEDSWEAGFSPETRTSGSRLLTKFGNVDESETKKLFVPVGVSRLHLVELPNMEMKPIYWSPINDISTVVRATWFYKDSMQPVSADVANRLEIGYEDMRPFSDTYQDEISACIENGAAAELKVVHRLWPDEPVPSRPGTALEDKNDRRELDDEMVEEMALPNATENAAVDTRKTKKRKLFESHSVIYIDMNDAQILRPNALPSISRNRKPLNSIRKGREIGVAVTRGFDRTIWEKLHPPPQSDSEVMQAQMGASMSQSGVAATEGYRASCPRCEEDAKRPRVSDLILVVHGIGQKLSERVDSYHFTHAINGLRREFNVELAAESVRSSLNNNSGMMVLPVNWRLTVQFDEGQQTAENKYELKDVTPETLPAVRSLISDVMLDIPYYMSHHKSRMTSAVIREANKVYRLWCKNNPGFDNYGRVHILAHSLGSVMAMEILSNQPTFVPDELDLYRSPTSDKMFEFNTTNLFCCGSPSGFFLLLHNANLVPRKGRNKTGMEGEDAGRGVAGEAGQYGCPAVDNVYNICHRNDPIAYQQNACVDSDYAASLRPASIPSATQSIFGKIGNSLRWAGSSAYDAYGYVGSGVRPTMHHMPSTVEMETHDFTREEIAERRMYLLNDNGQIDFFLNSGGGPLEIQYLNMLSAHSSYWYLRDFVRFLVVEIGRQPGRQHTLPVLRAVKKREYKKGAIV